MNEEYGEEVSSLSIDLNQINKRMNFIFLLSFLGFKATFNKDKELCEIFIKIMYESNQVKNSLKTIFSKL
ncbi:MAG: hypothetical protein DRJ34_04410 [Thermoprotei archaeon]|mgnify:CR=1 FL=1|nr:MAG: hypothetical protein DRJ34_04410 [Thermoprotei archaeon]